MQILRGLCGGGGRIAIPEVPAADAHPGRAPCVCVCVRSPPEAARLLREACPHGPYCAGCVSAMRRHTLPFCHGCSALVLRLEAEAEPPPMAPEAAAMATAPVESAADAARPAPGGELSGLD